MPTMGMHERIAVIEMVALCKQGFALYVLIRKADVLWIRQFLFFIIHVFKIIVKKIKYNIN